MNVSQAKMPKYKTITEQFGELVMNIEIEEYDDSTEYNLNIEYQNINMDISEPFCCHEKTEWENLRDSLDNGLGSIFFYPGNSTGSICIKNELMIINIHTGGADGDDVSLSSSIPLEGNRNDLRDMFNRIIEIGYDV